MLDHLNNSSEKVTNKSKLSILRTEISLIHYVSSDDLTLPILILVEFSTKQ